MAEENLRELIELIDSKLSGLAAELRVFQGDLAVRAAAVTARELDVYGNDGMIPGVFLAEVAEGLRDIGRVDTHVKVLRDIEEKVDLILCYVSDVQHDVHLISNTEIREAVWNMTGGQCYYCSTQLIKSDELGDPSRRFHVDHLVPRSARGPDHISNYVPACQACNVAKGSMPFAAFFKKKREEAKIISLNRSREAS